MYIVGEKVNLQMKEIQTITKKLRKIYDSFALVINNGGFINARSAKAYTMMTLIQELQNKVQPYSKSCASLLNDIHNNFFFPNPIGVDAFRFGKLEAVLTYLESSDFVCDFAKYLDTPWEDINFSIRKLLEDSANASDRLSYNQVGVLGREIYIMLAKKVYRPEMDTCEDGKKIGPADAKGMISSYIKYTLKGTSYEDLRSYADKAIKFAEHVTHSKTEDKASMEILVTAVIALVSLISIVYKSSSK